LQTLCDGLERMPNILTLTLRDTVLYNDMDNPKNPHGWYLWKTLDEFELVKVPSRWAMGDDMERNSIETTRSWDLRGVTNLYRALAHVDVKLLNFIAGGTDTQPLPLQTLTIPESPGPVLGSRLVSLNLMIEWTSVFGTRDNDGLFTDDLAIANCRSFLSSLKLLENLEVIGDWFDESEPWIMCFDGLHWPQLKQLELIGLTITRAQLLNLTLMHKSSLRELRMISICLIDRVADDGNWDFKTKELGKSLTLNGVSLCNLAEESDVPVIYGRPAVIEQNHVRLASNFMPEHPLSWSTEELYQEELYQEELHPNATVTNARRIDKTAATFQRNAISPD